MISFALAQQLKQAGFTQRTNGRATYFINEHLLINREDAINIWFADKAKQEWDFKMEEELVYCPTMTDLIEGCGFPFALSSDAAGHWAAKNFILGETAIGEGATAAEAVARLWLVVHSKI